MGSGRFDAVLFDVGGTLWVGDGRRRMRTAAAELGVAIDDAQALQVWNEIALQSRSPGELAKQRDLNPEVHRRCWLDLLSPADVLAPGMSVLLYEQEFRPESFVVYPDTLPTLQALTGMGARLGVISDVGHDIRGHLRFHGLYEFFDSCVLSYEHGAVKPDSRLFLAACEELDVTPGKALMVGDTPTSDGGAVAAGLMALILPSVGAGLPRGLDAAVSLVASVDDSRQPEAGHARSVSLSGA